MNKVFLIGRLVKDIELRTTQSGISYTSFTLAVPRKYTDDDGGKQADFLNCIAWRGTADFLSKYVKKGFLISIEGNIQTRNYKNSDGKTVYLTEVMCESVESLTFKKAQETQENNEYYEQPSQSDLPF